MFIAADEPKIRKTNIIVLQNVREEEGKYEERHGS